jgi:Zn-dependent protease with chaperone function
MTYENPDVPHEVNVSREGAVAEFLRLLAGIGIVVLVLSVLLYISGAWLARQLPVSMEHAWVGDEVLGLPVQQADTRRAEAIEVQLQQLADALAQHVPLPDGMDVTVHYTESDVPNAFATLGGHVVVTSALYERLPSENALALVLAHELAHLAARDPIAAVGGGLTLALASMTLTGDASAVFAPLTAVVQRGYSRDAERAADDLAIAAIRAHYGHAGGGAALFEVLAAARADAAIDMPSMLSTHPADAERIERVRAAARGWDPRTQPLRAITRPPST